MSDLLQRLRYGCIEGSGTGWLRGVDETKTDALLDEAADEIERLAKTTFALTDSQEKAANTWIETRNMEDCGPIGGRWSYRFTPTSIGMCVAVVDNATGEELDLADYDSF